MTSQNLAHYNSLESKDQSESAISDSKLNLESHTDSKIISESIFSDSKIIQNLATPSLRDLRSKSWQSTEKANNAIVFRLETKAISESILESTAFAFFYMDCFACQL